MKFKLITILLISIFLYSCGGITLESQQATERKEIIKEDTTTTFKYKATEQLLKNTSMNIVEVPTNSGTLLIIRGSRCITSINLTKDSLEIEYYKQQLKKQ